LKFDLKTLHADGRLVTVSIDAADAADARRIAGSQGLALVGLRSAWPWARWRRRSRGAALSITLFGHELVALLDAGLSLVEAIDLLAAKERDRAAAAVLRALRDDLHRGSRFADALQRQPHAFPDLFVAAARAAQGSGDLQEALTRYLEYRAQIDRVRDKLVSASVYPLLLLGVGSLVLAFMLFYVVPKFSRLYDEIGGELPALTRVLVAWGALLEAHAAAVTVTALAALALAGFALTRPALHRWLAPRLWRLPALGERLRVYELARFYRTLGMLLKSGIALPAALDMAGGLLSPLLRHALERAATAVRAGQPVSAAFEREGLTTQVSLRLLAVGERSGRMPQMVTRIASFHDDELARWIDWFVRLFEPALMLLIGALVGLIVVLLYLPIFELADSIG
jgi:general secretion pathway protein F